MRVAEKRAGDQTWARRRTPDGGVKGKSNNLNTNLQYFVQYLLQASQATTYSILTPRRCGVFAHEAIATSGEASSSVACRPLLALLSAKLINCLQLASQRLALLLAGARRFVERLALPLVDDGAVQELVARRVLIERGSFHYKGTSWNSIFNIYINKIK
jgi:hypothetical protein